MLVLTLLVLLALGLLLVLLALGLRALGLVALGLLLVLLALGRVRHAPQVFLFFWRECLLFLGRKATIEQLPPTHCLQNLSSSEGS